VEDSASRPALRATHSLSVFSFSCVPWQDARRSRVPRPRRHLGPIGAEGAPSPPVAYRAVAGVLADDGADVFVVLPHGCPVPESASSLDAGRLVDAVLTDEARGRRDEVAEPLARRGGERDDSST
jgi:hypothetical protein